MIYPASPAARSMPSGVDQPPPRKISPRDLRLVPTGLTLASTLASLDQNIVAPALPYTTGKLGGLQHLSWVAANTVSSVVFLRGSVLCGLANDVIEPIVFRAVQGPGAGARGRRPPIRAARPGQAAGGAADPAA